MLKFCTLLFGGVALSGAAALFVAAGAGAPAAAGVPAGRVQKVVERFAADASVEPGSGIIFGTVSRTERTDVVDQTKPRRTLVALSW